MKKCLRLFLVNTVGLWLVASLLTGVTFINGWQAVAKTALVLTLIDLTIKPLLKVLLLPINLLTLGAFRWLVNVAALYLVTLIVPQFKVQPFLFPGYSSQGFVIPPIFLGNFLVFVLTSFFLSLTTTFLLWLAQ